MARRLHKRKEDIESKAHEYAAFRLVLEVEYQRAEIMIESTQRFEIKIDDQQTRTVENGSVE